MGNMPPQIATSKLKSTIITHREYITDVVSSTAANTALTLNTNLFAFPIQPASSITFPWLSTIAAGFQEYRLLGMVFEFKSTCGSAVSSTNNAMGSVLMSTQYRAGAPVFANKMQMDNEQYSTDVVPWTNSCHFIECAPHLSPLTTLYTRTGPVTNESIELFDIGTLYLATTGQQQSSVVLGELWCSYQVELLKPQLPKGSGSAGPAILTAHFTSNTYSNAFPINGLTLDSGSNIALDGVGPTSFTLSANQFNTQSILYISAVWIGTSVTSSIVPFTTSNATPHYEFNGSSQDAAISPVTGTVTISLTSLRIVHIVNGALPITIAMPAGVVPGSGNLDIIITQLNDDD